MKRRQLLALVGALYAGGMPADEIDCAVQPQQSCSSCLGGQAMLP